MKHCSFRNSKIPIFKTAVNSLDHMGHYNIKQFFVVAFLYRTVQNKLALNQAVNEMVIFGICFGFKI